MERIPEQLLPLLDRSNRVMLRNLKALQARREGPAPSVSIGAAQQVNAIQQAEAGVAEQGRPNDPHAVSG